MKRAFVLLFSLFLPSVYASEDSSSHKQHQAHNNHDDEKALQKVDIKKGFVLSKESLKAMGVEFIQYSKLKDSKIPTSALVFIKNIKGVYVLREGFIKFIEWKDELELRPDDYLVTQGLGVIAITDVYSKDSSDYSHSH